MKKINMRPTIEAVKKLALDYCDSIVNESPTKRSSIIRLKKSINSQVQHIELMKECLGNSLSGRMYGEMITDEDLQQNEWELDVMEWYLRFRLGYIYKN
jgi:hypothetical protein